MKNNKIIGIMLIITVLLGTTISGIIANTTITLKNGQNLNKVAQESNIENTKNDSNESEYIEDTVFDEAFSIAKNIQELRIASTNGNTVAADISSRSTIDRAGNLYINTDPSKQQDPEEYEELRQYIKLEDLKISFDMDVSKTTGLSKEDFIKFVQNMKCDRTGILAKNAGCIWECCQKYNVNEIFVLGICGIESAWCSAPQHQNTHNYSSLMTGGKLIPYPSDEAGFEAMIKLLGERYLTPGASFYHGATITGVGRCYCNPTSWPGKVYTCMQQAMK